MALINCSNMDLVLVRMTNCSILADCRNKMGINLSTPILMMSTGVIGNFLALLLLYTTTKETRQTNFFPLLAGLAWTDLIGQLMTAPVAIAAYANNFRWAEAKPICIYHGFAMIFFGLLTPLLVCTLSLERLFSLKFSYVYVRLVSQTKAKLTVVVSWVAVSLFCCLPLVGVGSYKLQYPCSWCFLNFNNGTWSESVYAFSFAALNVSLIAAIVVCNVTVVVTLLKMKRSRKVNSSPSSSIRQVGPKARSPLRIEMETQMVWFLCAVTIVFCTCWLPLNIHILITLTGDDNPKRGLVVIRMAGINQILDPWLYILLRKNMFCKLIQPLQKLYSSTRRFTESQRKSFGQSSLGQGIIARIDNSANRAPVDGKEQNKILLNSAETKEANNCQNGPTFAADALETAIIPLECVDTRSASPASENPKNSGSLLDRMPYGRFRSTMKLPDDHIRFGLIGSEIPQLILGKEKAGEEATRTYRMRSLPADFTLRDQSV